MLGIVQAIVLAVAAMGFVSSWPDAAGAQQVQAQPQPGGDGAKSKPARQPSAKKPKAPATAAEGGSAGVDAEATLDKARRALGEGKADAAVGLAESVLNGAKKDARNTARALAVRGEGRLKQGRQAEAMADLENALWVKGGLAGAEREAAVAARALAMQQSGLAASPPPAAVNPTPTVALAPPPIVNTAPAAPRRAPEPAAAVAKSAPQPAEPRVQQAASNPPPSPPPAARAPSPPPLVPTAAPVQAQPRAPVASVAPAAAPASDGGIGGFFSNLFGGGSSESQPEAERKTRAPATTATIPASRPTQPAVSSSEPQRAEARTSKPAPQPVEKQVRVAAATTAVAAARPAAAPPEAASGYRIQLAAVRSKSEAEAMAATVRKSEAATLGNRNFEIVEDVYGNMGKFFRARIGPFAGPTEAMAVCTTLRRKQLDCMVLDQ